MGNFLFQFIDLLLQALTWLILIRVLITWIPNLDPFNPIVRLLRQATDPILEPARRIIPPIGGMDVSPIVVILILQGLQMLLRRLA
ncbi:MAG: YggT family protein [Anaerolineae bacterium]|nr:YggT family protein [Anaerolineae bacterium]MCB9130423.1 YggT family protein [Anaerolineales bacterium]MCO5242327.1 YggT family protein [Anaerolineae bacterium]HRX02019.1 YggT family protein [Anaerolineae bacterium]